jgi:hypothetical protein
MSGKINPETCSPSPEPKRRFAMTEGFDIMSKEFCQWEVAREILSEMCAIRHKMIMRESDSPQPDAALIERWEAEFDQFARMEYDLRVEDQEEVLRILEEYGPQVRAWYGEAKAELEAEAKAPDDEVGEAGHEREEES